MTKICNDKTGSDKKLHVFCEFVIAAIIGSHHLSISPPRGLRLP